MTGDAHRRLYFALWPDVTLRGAIAAAAAGPVAAAGGRPVPPANLHATLAFLGAVPSGRVPGVVAAANGVRATRGNQAFDRIRTWPRGGPLVLEATRVAPELDALRATLANALVAADFPVDGREFRPHITLAHAPDRGCRPVPAHVEWRFETFVLVESRLGPAGSRYEVIETFALG